MTEMWRYQDELSKLTAINANYWEGGDAYTKQIGILAETFANIPENMKSIRQSLAQKAMLYAMCFILYDYLTYEEEMINEDEARKNIKEVKRECDKTITELLPELNADAHDTIVENLLLRIFHIVRGVDGGEKSVMGLRYPNEIFNDLLNIMKDDLLSEEKAQLLYCASDDEFNYYKTIVLSPARPELIKSVNWDGMFDTYEKLELFIKVIVGYYSLQDTYYDSRDLESNPDIIARSVVRNLRKQRDLI